MGLSADQWRYVAARVRCRTVAEVVSGHGIPANTAYAYDNDPEVREAVTKGTSDLVWVASMQLESMLTRATEVLEEAMSATTPDGEADVRARTAAAKLVLQSKGMLKSSTDISSGGKSLKIVLGIGEDGEDGA
jgi:hypothetical protein